MRSESPQIRKLPKSGATRETCAMICDGSRSGLSVPHAIIGPIETPASRSGSQVAMGDGRGFFHELAAPSTRR